MQANSSTTNFFFLSLFTSSTLAFMGLFFVFFVTSTWLVLFSIIIFVVGTVQLIADFGWVSIIKINSNLPTWKEAYTIVAKKRTQKIFLIPILMDFSFVMIAIVLFTSVRM